MSYLKKPNEQAHDSFIALNEQLILMKNEQY
jgi:hypothetical protein